MPNGKEMKAIISIAGTIDPSLGQAIAQATRQTSGLGAAFKVAGAVGAAAMTAAIAGTVKFASAAVEAATTYEQAFRNASTLMQGTDEGLKAISDDILKVSTESGIAAEDLANSVYSAISAGIDQADAVEFAGKAARLAAAGFTDVDTALTATAKTLNAYGMDASHTDEIQRMLIQTQNLGITTVGELGASLAQVTPTAAAFGVSFDQVSAALAGMTAQGTPTAQSTTQLNSLIAELGKSGTVASKNFARLTEHVKEGGLTFSEAMESGWDLNDVLSLFDEEASATGKSMVDMFSSIEAGKAALSIWNSDFAGNLEAMGTSADVVGEAYDKVAGSFEHQSELMKNMLHNFMIESGSAILPYLTSAAQVIFPAVQDLLDGILPLIGDAAERIMPIITDVAAEIPPVLEQMTPFIQETIGFVAQNVSRIMSLIMRLMPVISNIASALGNTLAPILDNINNSAMTAIETFVSSALPPLLDSILSIADLMPTIMTALQPIINIALALLPIIMDFLGSILTALSPIATFIAGELATVLQMLTPMIQTLFEAVVPVLSQIVGALLPPIMDILSAVLPLLQAIFAALNPIIEVVTNIINTILPLVAESVSFLIATLQPAIDFITIAFTTAIESILPAFESVIIPVMTHLQNLLDFIVNVFTGNWAAAWESVKNIFRSAFEALAGFIKAPMNAVIAVINGAIEAINSLSIEIPAWVPEYGGQVFGLSIAQLPYLARGGFTNGVSIAGEAGTEAVISFDPAVRQQNLSYWAKAGKLLGANPTAVDTVAASAKESGGGGNQITFSPNVTIQGNADYDVVMQALRDNEEEFMDMLNEFFGRQQAVSYG